MEAKSPNMNAAPNQTIDTDHSNGDNVVFNTDLNARSQDFHNRLDKMSDQMQVMRQKVLRLRKAIENLQDSDE